MKDERGAVPFLMGRIESLEDELEETYRGITLITAELAANSNARLSRLKAEREKLRIAMSSAHQDIEQLSEDVAVSNATLAARNRELEERNRELTEISHIISHDLQAPIRHIRFFTRVLSEDLGTPAPEIARSLALVEEAASDMESMVQNLLLLSRVGTQALSLERVSLETCVAQVLQILAPTVEATNAIVERDPLPEIVGHRTLLLQLYQNLISNALKFTAPQTLPRCRLTATRQGKGWSLGIKDNGIGVEPRFSERIFSPFQRLRPDDFDGTGIGLSICRKIVLLHEGWIKVVSLPGNGSWFQFHLPDRRLPQGLPASERRP